VQELDGDVALEGAVVPARQEHLTHAALAQGLEQLVGAHALGRGLGRGQVGDQRHRALGQAVAAFGLGVGGQQRGQLAGHVRFLGAHPGQERGQLRRRQLEALVEQALQPAERGAADMAPG
jgi:hypothetical protein